MIIACTSCCSSARATSGTGGLSGVVRARRSPIPLLAIRQVVENDAPFALRHPLLIPTYVWKDSRSAPKRLLGGLAKGR
jgi:hypothetical protein